MATVLRIMLDREFERDALRALHASGSAADAPQELRALFDAIGVTSIASVHAVSAAEIADDPYGFAREFTLVLDDRVEQSVALARLAASPLIASAKPLHFESPS